MDYKLKYLKYKAKYLYLKEQLGGEMYYDSSLPIIEITNTNEIYNLELGKRRFKIKDSNLLKQIFDKINTENNNIPNKLIDANKNLREYKQAHPKRTKTDNAEINKLEAIIRDLKRSARNIKIFVVGSESSFGDIVKIDDSGNTVNITYKWGIAGNYELEEPKNEIENKWFFVLYQTSLV